MSKNIVRYDPDQKLSDMVEYNGTLYLAGQVAGVQDSVPDQRVRSRVVRRLKQASMAQLTVRRRSIE